jgi:hypothetical protein
MGTLLSGFAAIYCLNEWDKRMKESEKEWERRLAERKIDLLSPFSPKFSLLAVLKTVVIKMFEENDVWSEYDWTDMDDDWNEDDDWCVKENLKDYIKWLKKLLNVKLLSVVV